MSGPLLQTCNLVRRYHGRRVLDVEALALHRGEILAVVGPNGAGKSTLFRVLLGLERPDEGSVTRGSAADGRTLLMMGVFQRPFLFSGTVLHNVRYGLRARRTAGGDDHARAALAALDIAELATADVRTLSGGEAQRVALARATVAKPDVLMLDEPTASLDVSTRRRFREDLERVARDSAGGTLIVTHDATEAMSIADRVAVLEGGRVVQAGTPDEILLNPATPFIAELSGAEVGLHGVVVDEQDGLLTVQVAGGLRVQALTRELLGRGAGVVVAYRPEDVLLATDASSAGSSALNRMPATVEALVPAGPLVRVRLRHTDGPVALTALVTRQSVANLGLEPGARVTALMKATALHAWQREGRR